jgi:hypothetical protein
MTARVDKNSLAWEPPPFPDQTVSLMRRAVLQRGTWLMSVAAERYRALFAQWADDSCHVVAEYDTDRIGRLREIAEASLGEVARRYDARQLLHAVRSLPFPAVMQIASGRFDPSAGQVFCEVVAVATAATLRHGRRKRAVRVGSGSALLSTEQEYRDLQMRLPEDVARLLAAALLRVNAARLYRTAGKGRHLRDLPAAADVRSRRAAPECSFLEDPPVARAIDDYERRRDLAYGAPGSYLSAGNPSWSWLELAGTREPLTMSFPALDLSMTTHNFVYLPSSDDGWLRELSWFSARLSAVFGVDSGALTAICARLAGAVWRQAAMDTLRDEDTGRFEFTFGITPDDPRARGVLGVLYDLNFKGLLRASRAEWVEMFAQACCDAGCASPGQQAQAFVDAFTAKPASQLGPYWPDLVPQLFYEADATLLTLDLLNCKPFLQACYRVATAGSGTTGSERGDRFEEQARERIRAGLHLNPSDEPHKAHTIIPRRKDLGDVDHCFTVGRMLIVLDMKSHLRTLAYHHGDFNAIDTRQLQLVEDLAKVERRATVLLETLRKSHPQLDTVCSFLCVADVEYISPYYKELWYRRLPRVLTPDEIIELAASSRRISALRKDQQHKAT